MHSADDIRTNSEPIKEIVTANWFSFISVVLLPFLPAPFSKWEVRLLILLLCGTKNTYGKGEHTVWLLTEYLLLLRREILSRYKSLNSLARKKRYEEFFR